MVSLTVGFPKIMLECSNCVPSKKRISSSFLTLSGIFYLIGVSLSLAASGNEGVATVLEYGVS